MKSIPIKLMAFAIIAATLPNLILAQGGNSVRNINNKMNVTSFNKYVLGATVDVGHYIIQQNDDALCVQLADNTNRKKQHYRIENCFDLKEVIHSDHGFSSINRKAGVLSFQHSSASTGEFKFKKDPDFVTFLKSEGVELNNDLYYFKLFLGDISKAYVLDIISLGFEPTITELGRLVWHDASVVYINEMSKMFPNFTLDDISMMSAHNVTLDYVKELSASGEIKMDVHSIKKAVLNKSNHK